MKENNLLKTGADDIVLSICCITYNHAAYIQKCIEGFLMQKTSFPIEILIHDDASTDGTAEIVKEFAEKYPDLIFPVFQEENKYSQGINVAADYLLPRVRGKYIAVCEGDDYWIDPTKLQRQVDFLESHPSFSFCCHQTYIYEQNTGEMSLWKIKEEKILETDFSFTCKEWTRLDWFFHMLTIVLRKDMLDLPFLMSFKRCYGVHIFYQLLQKGNAYFFATPMSVYRIHKTGVFRGLSYEQRGKMNLEVFHELYQKTADPLAKHWLGSKMNELSLAYLRYGHLLRFFHMVVLTASYCGMDGLGRLGIDIFNRFAQGLKKKCISK